jgi:hypothetical protein
MARVETNFAPAVDPLLADARPAVSSFFADRERLLFAALVLVHLTPVWAFSYFPTDDGPSHVYNASVLRDYAKPGAEILREYYALSTHPDPNWFGHLVLVALMHVMPATVAEKVIVSGYVILLPLAVRYALRAINPSAGWLAVLALPFVFNFTLLKGFYNFSYSLAVFFFLIGYWVRHRDDFDWKRSIALGLLSLLLYFCHIVSLAAAYALLGILALSFVLIDRTRERVRTHMVLPLIAFVPTLLLVGTFLARQGVDSYDVPLTKKLLKLASLYSLVLFDQREIIITSGLAVFLSLCAVYGFVRATRGRFDVLLAIAVFFAAVCLLAPDQLSGGGLIIDRLVLYPYFAVILWLATRAWRDWERRVVQVVAVTAAVTLLAWRLPAQARISGMMHDYLAAAAHVETDKTILGLPFTDRVYSEGGTITSLRIFPFKHAVGLLAAGRNIVDLANYEASTGYFPVLFRDGRSMAHRVSLLRDMDAPPAVDIAGYEARTGGRVDYVLLWQVRDEQRSDPAALDVFRQLDAGYEKVFTSESGRVELYRKRAVGR